MRGRGAGGCVRSALRSCSLGSPGRTRVFPPPLPDAAPSWGLPRPLLPLPLWEELNFPASVCNVREDQLFKVDGRSELGRAFTLEAPEAGSGCLREGSLRAGGPATSSIVTPPREGERCSPGPEGRGGGPAASVAHTPGQHGLQNWFKCPPHMPCAAPERPLQPSAPSVNRWSALQPGASVLAGIHLCSPEPRHPAGIQLCS